MIDHVIARDVLATVCFGAFVAGAAWSAPRLGESGRQKRRAIVFTLWTFAASLGIGITQKDLFPFTSWTLVAWLCPQPLQLRRYVVVDAAGAEHAVDHRAWQPMSVDELGTWIAQYFLRLDDAGRAVAARDLLRRANDGAEKVRANEHLGTYDRFLGPFAAPLFEFHLATWRAAADVPPLPFRAFRIYAEDWYPENATTGKTSRRLLYEYVVAP